MGRDHHGYGHLHFLLGKPIRGVLPDALGTRPEIQYQVIHQEAVFVLAVAAREIGPVERAFFLAWFAGPVEAVARRLECDAREDGRAQSRWPDLHEDYAGHLGT